MFPARAGMNRLFADFTFDGVYVPRTSGDEPVSPTTQPFVLKCSPHERG